MYTLSSIKYRQMQNNLWYNRVVPNSGEKKDQPLALRVPVSLLDTLGDIARAEDRPLGYVARELMIRGLGLYSADGHLRDQIPLDADGKVAATIAPGSIEEARKLYEQNVEALTQSTSKARKVPHFGEVGGKGGQKARKTG